MASQNDNLMMYVAVYDSVDQAEADLDAIEQLHKDGLIGTFDAAIVQTKDGRSRIVRRLDRPRIRVVPEEFDAGKLPRNELKEAAAELSAGEAALFLVGEATIEQALDKALTHAAKTLRRTIDTTMDELAREMKEASKH